MNEKEITRYHYLMEYMASEVLRDDSNAWVDVDSETYIEFAKLTVKYLREKGLLEIRQTQEIQVILK